MVNSQMVENYRIEDLLDIMARLRAADRLKTASAPSSGAALRTLEARPYTAQAAPPMTPGRTCP